ncbi:MAG: NERD domain-containing protein [Armatimonadota bacterium]|nr:MAG: NERD domain-containing protein [Armatimonadota bacterium]
MARVVKEATTLQRQALIAFLAGASTWLVAAGSIWLVARSRPHDLNGLLLFFIPVGLFGIAKKVTDFTLIYIRGYLGERRVFAELRKLPDDYWIFNDVTIRVGEDSAQIDHILVSPYGLWCIETKSLRGTIRGKENERHWTQIKRPDSGRTRREKFYNPVAQNATHCRRLGEYLKQHLGVTLPVRSAVVFTGAQLEVDTATPAVSTRELRGVIQRSDTQACLEESKLRVILDALTQRERPREQPIPPAEDAPTTC